LFQEQLFLCSLCSSKLVPETSCSWNNFPVLLQTPSALTCSRNKLFSSAPSAPPDSRLVPGTSCTCICSGNKLFLHWYLLPEQVVPALVLTPGTLCTLLLEQITVVLVLVLAPEMSCSQNKLHLYVLPQQVVLAFGLVPGTNCTQCNYQAFCQKKIDFSVYTTGLTIIYFPNPIT
jgi:hypothetical protein